MLDRLRECAEGGGSALLHGPAGIGKTALLDVVARHAASTGTLVLRSCPTAGEAQLPHVALIDLLGEAVVQVEHKLPEHLRQALRAAMLLDGSPTAPIDPLAVRIAVMEALRCLADRGPLLVVLDDIQWLDDQSRHVLAFVLRRLVGSRIAMIAAERADEGPTNDVLRQPHTVDIPVAGLSEAGVARLLADRLGVEVTGLALRRIFRASAGNPFLAIEFGRAMSAGRPDGSPSDPACPLTVPGRLRALALATLAGLPQTTRHALLLLAAARNATELPPAALQALGPAINGQAVRWGPHQRPRFVQPLLEEIVYSDADPASRQKAHHTLSRLTSDPVEHAWHTAHATTTPTATVGTLLTAAADTATHRAAPGTAAELLRLAAFHTPNDTTAGAQRLLDAARHATTAGQLDFALTCARELFDATQADIRVQARLMAVRILNHNHADTPALLTAALQEPQASDDSACAAHLEAAIHALHHGDSATARTHLDQAQARVADDEQRRLDVLAVRARFHLLTASPQGTALFEEGRRLSAPHGLNEAAVKIRRGLATAYLRAGSTQRAVTEIEMLRAEVEQTGRRDLTYDILHIAATIHERAGNCSKARSLYLAAADTFALTEKGLQPAEVFKAAAELIAGEADRAVVILQAAIGPLGAVGDLEWLSYAHCLLGRAQLVTGDANGAAQQLNRAAVLLDRLGYHDPALLLLDADLAEALVLAGQVEEAAHVIAEARSRSDRHERHLVHLGLDRAQAILMAAGDPRRAADSLRAALPAYHPYPLEKARAQLVLGQLERRNRRRAAARADLNAAAAAFRQAGCAPWLRVAEATVVAMDSADTRSSPAQQMIIDMLCAGSTNRQIASRLHLSVKAVEAQLTRIYRQHGASGRADLIQLLEG